MTEDLTEKSRMEVRRFGIELDVSDRGSFEVLWLVAVVAALVTVEEVASVLAVEEELWGA